MKLRHAFRGFLYLACLGPAAVHASFGVGSSGGGMAVVCDKSSTLQTVELLDIYEAKLLPKLSVLKSSGDLLEDYSRLTDNSLRLQGANWRPSAEEQKKNLLHMMGLIDWHEGPVPLPFLNDQGRSPKLPANCQLVQLAIFFDSTERINVDKQLWERMDTINQAALLKHESYYYNERLLNDTTSESTRSYVRQEAATGFTPASDGSGSNADCTAYNGTNPNTDGLTSFYLYRVDSQVAGEDTLMQMTLVAGRRIFVKASVLFKDLTFAVREVKDRFGQPYLVPQSSAVNKIMRSKIETDHRDDWELKIKFVANQPIELTVFQSGIELAKSSLRICTRPERR